MTGIIEEQAVIFLTPVFDDELAYRPFEFHTVRILHEDHRKTIVLQRLAHLAHVFTNPSEPGPARRVVAHPDHQRMTLLIKPDLFTRLGFDFNPGDAAF